MAPSSFSRNDGIIRILTYLGAKHHGKLPTTDNFDTNNVVSIYDFAANICFEVIIVLLFNKRDISLFYHFFLQIVHITEILRKVHNTTTKNPRTTVPCISQILTTVLNCILVKLGWVYNSTLSKMSGKQ